MSRNIVAVGLSAVQKSVEILATAQICDPASVTLEPGCQWRGDRMLLSVSAATVKFVAGSTLYEQDQDGFLVEEFQEGGPGAARQATWLRGLSRYEIPFCMGLAGTLAMEWTDTVSACPFLERFSNFYRNHRTQVELAARELRFVLEGLVAMRRWPALFGPLMESMGPQAQWSLPKGLSATDLGAFLGRLLIGSGESRVTLEGLPACIQGMREPVTPQLEECLSIPQYRRILDNLERAAERIAPLLTQLRQTV